MDTKSGVCKMKLINDKTYLNKNVCNSWGMREL